MLKVSQTPPTRCSFKILHRSTFEDSYFAMHDIVPACLKGKNMHSLTCEEIGMMKNLTNLICGTENY